MKRRLFTRLALAAVAVAAAAATTPALAQAQYPARPIQLIVPWAAGGGTDAVARFLASGLEKELGKPVNVVNRPGAAGVLGHTAIVQAKPDGYTIGLATAELATFHWMKTAPISYKDVTAVAQVNFDAAAFTVRNDSEWKDLKQLLESIRSEPGKNKLSGFGAGGGFHLAVSQVLDRAGIDPRGLVVVPSQGAAPGLQELVAGGVQVVGSSLPEVKAMREAGMVRTLAVIAQERLPAYPDVPTVAEAIGVDVAAGTWRGIVGPKGMPEEVVQKLSEATRKVTESDAFREQMSKQGFGVRWSSAADFEKFMAEADATNGVLIEKLGLVQ